jgi:hypothetical protein
MLENVLQGAKTAYHAVRGFATSEEITEPEMSWLPTRTMLPAVAFFKDSRRVATSFDSNVRTWDIENGALVGRPFWAQSGRPATPCIVAISPDDRRIASSTISSTLIWDVDEQKVVLGPLVKHTNRVKSLCFSPDHGKRLASGSIDGTVIIWDAETGAVLSTLTKPIKDGMVPGSVECVAFSPDGLHPDRGGTSGFGAPITPNFCSTLMTSWLEVLCGCLTASKLSLHRMTKQSSSGTPRMGFRSVHLALITLTKSTPWPSLLMAPSLPLPRAIGLCVCGAQSRTSR